MAVFRLHLRPTDVDPAAVTDFCLQQSVIGCGWRLAHWGQPDRLEDGETDFNKFWRAAEDYWEHQDPSERDRWWDGFAVAATALGTGIQANDYCWSRDATGNYWLGSVSSEPFRYRTGDPWDTYDIHMTRKIQMAFQFTAP